MREPMPIRGNVGAKVHLIKDDPHLRTTGTACFAYAAQDVLTTMDINKVTCVSCIRRSAYTR